jgi:hypothetical protein
MNIHNKNPKLNKSSNLENKKVKFKENKKNEEKVKQKEKKEEKVKPKEKNEEKVKQKEKEKEKVKPKEKEKEKRVVKIENNDDDDEKYKKDQYNKYKKNIESNNNKDDNEDINDDDNENDEEEDIEESDNEENEGEEEEDNNDDDDNEEYVNDSNKYNDYQDIKKNIIEKMNKNKENMKPSQYAKRNFNRNNSDFSGGASRNAKYKYDTQNNFNERMPRRNNQRQKTISSLRTRINRDRFYDDEDYNDRFYQTFNNFNDLKYMPKTPRIPNVINYFEDDLIYFPSEKYLVGRKDEIATYEAELDLLLKEKNNLESDIIKMPEHPRTLREIKIKRALNERLSVNEDNINKVKRKLRLMKEA